AGLRVLPRGIREARRPWHRRAGKGAGATRGETGRAQPAAQELRSRPRAVLHSAGDEDEPGARPELADVGADGETPRFAPAPRGARGGTADPRGTAQAISPPDAPQLCRALVSAPGGT